MIRSFERPKVHIGMALPMRTMLMHRPTAPLPHPMLGMGSKWELLGGLTGRHSIQIIGGGDSKATQQPLAPAAQSLAPPGLAQPSEQSAVGAAGSKSGSGASTPNDFDWRSYLLRYPDLRASNIRTREAAAYHYADNGRKEHRSYQRVPVLLRYTACQGLFNQMYAHLNALVLAEYLGADVVLPPSVYR